MSFQYWLINTNCIMICKRHVAFYLLCFEDVECIHRDHSFTVIVSDEKKKNVCSYCFEKHYINLLKKFTLCLIFFERKSLQIFFSNYFFSHDLLGINSREESRVFYKDVFL